jgi:hypothetical protein
MNNTILKQLKKYISINGIAFLSDFDRSIDVNKSSKSMYFKMLRIHFDNIKNFIENLDDDKIYMINPFISINSNYQDPILGLSRPFLITNESNSKLIHDFLFTQFEKGINDFGMELDPTFYLIFNYHSVNLEKRQ